MFIPSPLGYTWQQRAELWARYRAGDSIREIARDLAKNPGAVHGVIRLQGGITPRLRARSLRALSLEEREHISRALAADESYRAIGRRLGRAASTISREVAPHGGRTKYRAIRADSRAWDSARRPKACRLASRPRLMGRCRGGSGSCAGRCSARGSRTPGRFSKAATMWRPFRFLDLEAAVVSWQLSQAARRALARRRQRLDSPKGYSAATSSGEKKKYVSACAAVHYMAKVQVVGDPRPQKAISCLLTASCPTPNVVWRARSLVCEFTLLRRKS